MDKYITEMRNIFLILVMLGISNTLLSQNSFIKKDFDWKDWEVTFPTEEKIKLAKILSYEFLEEIGSIDSNFILENIDNFHLIDFNADGKLDIIYHGFAGAESDKTIFFLNKNGTLKKILGIYGGIINMKREAIYLPVSFQLMDYPCCENTTYSLKTYSPMIENGKFGFNLISSINYIKNTEFSKELVNPIPFEVVNETYKLRSSPVIDDKNIVSTYSKGSLGICIATKEDTETDRIWWLVIMYNNIEPTDTMLDEGNNQGKYYSIGWMSSRFLKEINALKSE